MRHMFWGFMCWLLLSPGLLFGFANKTTQGDCSPVITGDINAPIKIDCGKGSEIPIIALAKLENYMQESYRSQKNLNDLVDMLRSEVNEWEQKYKNALANNTADLTKNPNNPQLEAERQALQAGELEKAAQFREAYYQNLKQKKTTELAKEAFTAAERWESAFNLPRALTLYQEATQFRRDYLRAWRNIGSIAKKLGNYPLALEAAQNLQKQLDPEKDQWWLAVAFSDGGDALKVLGHNKTALKRYQEAHALFYQLTKANPDNLDIQRDLSVSHNKVGDMHAKNGDNVAALKAFQDGLAIAKILADLDPNIVQWQTDLVVSYYKLSQIQVDKRKKLLGDALAILQRLSAENRLNYEQQGWIKFLEEQLELNSPQHKNYK